MAYKKQQNSSCGGKEDTKQKSNPPGKWDCGNLNGISHTKNSKIICKIGAGGGLSRALFGIITERKFSSRNLFKKTINRNFRLQQNPPQKWRWDEAPSPPVPQALASHFPQAPPRGPTHRNLPGRSPTTAHARHVVTCVPRTPRSWQEGPCQLPPSHRFGAPAACSRCLRRRGAAGVPWAELGARGGAAMGLRRAR